MFSNAIDRMPAAFLDRGKVIRLDTSSIVYLAFEPRPLITFDIRQARYAMPMQAAVQRRSRQV